VEARHAANHGGVVGKAAITVQRRKIAENKFDVVLDVGSLGMAGELDAMPGGQFSRGFPAQAIEAPAKRLQVFGAAVGRRLAREILDLPLEELIAWSAKHDILRDGLAFSKGPENTVCTANAMNSLLRKIYNGELFDGDARELAMNILLKQQFNVRLSRFLPPGVKVAHKTGTIGGIRNDSGIIMLGESNHVILTIFTEWDEAPYWNKPAAHHQRVFEVESAMGEIGIAVDEAFLAPD